MNRLNRRWLENTNSMPTAAPATAATAIGTSGVPPTKATANTMQPQHDRRAEVALQQAQPGGQRGDPQRGVQRAAEVVHLGARAW